MLKFLLSLLLIFILSVKANAHPHVWIENSINLIMENKKIQAINVKWVYDEFYSSAAFFEADLNDDKTLSTAEQLKLLDNNYEELRKNNFFTHLKLNKQELKSFDIKKFNVYFKDEILNIEFNILPRKPINPVNNDFTASFYDDSYFIEVYFQEDKPVEFTGNSSAACKYKQYEDVTEAYYYDMVYPETIKVICR